MQGLKDRLRRRFNAAFAELDHQDVWQRASVGIVTCNAQASVVEGLLDQVQRDIEGHLNGMITAVERRLI
jgi:hypothetical protein